MRYTCRFWRRQWAQAFRSVTQPEACLGSRQKASFDSATWNRVITEVKAVMGESGHVRTRLVEIRGTSGVGKSAFLAYVLAVLRKRGLRNAAIFHATKCAKLASGGMDIDAVRGSMWIDGNLVASNLPFNEIRVLLELHMRSLEVIIMDGCSMTFSLEEFDGLVLVAASPCLYTRNLRQAILRNVVLYMPTWSMAEGLQLAQILDVDPVTVEENFLYMEGIVRYMLDEGSAKKTVMDAVGIVNAKSLVDMLSTQMTDKTKESVAVHALVRWNTKKDTEGCFHYDQSPSFDMVSMFAEKLVAEKLATLESHELYSSWRRLQPLSGAEGYAGALFEAYAVRRFLLGGTFSLISLADGQTKSVSVPVLDKRGMQQTLTQHSAVGRRDE